MNQRTIQEIQAEMDAVSNTGNLSKMMDLFDEHENTIDKMYKAIIDGDVDRITELENLGMDVTAENFVKAAIIHEQLLVIVYQVSKGAEIEMIIDFAKQKDEPLVSGTIVFSGSTLIWQWTKSWKSAKALDDKLPAKGQIGKITKI